MGCPSCQNTDQVIFLISRRAYKIYHCSNCDLIFAQSSQYSDRKWYEAELIDKTAMVLPEVWLKWQEKMYKRFLNRKFKASERTLLDIGCGDGRFLKKANDLGYKVSGIDLNRILINKIRNESDIKVYSMDLKKFNNKFSYKRFDVITFFEVLEHIKNPNNFINLVKNNLNNHGRIVVSVPNRDRFRFELEKYQKWDSPPHHNTWWSERALKSLLIRKGFNILDFKKFKKKIRIVIRKGSENNKKENELTSQLCIYGKVKYFIYKKIVSWFVFMLTKRKFLRVQISVTGPYLFCIAQLKK